MRIKRNALLRAGAFVLLASAEYAQPAKPEPADGPPAAYLLAPNDVLIVRASNAEELSDKPFRVDLDGFLNLPLAGRIRAGGLTVGQFEAVLNTELRKFIKNPQAVVGIVERAKPETVSVLGAFKNPGAFPLGGRETLLQVVSRAGGLLPNANRRIKLIRRVEQGAIPLPRAAPEPGGETSAVDIELTAAMELVNSGDNIELKPSDVLSATRQEMIYLTGELLKAGAYSLEDRDSYSVIQLVSVSGGLTREADPRKARILRLAADGSRRTEIPIDIKAIMAGQATDVRLLPNDVLVVPRSAKKSSAISRTLLYAIPAAITSAIYVAAR